MTPIDGSRAPILPGPALVARIGALQGQADVHRVRWRFMIDWWRRRRKYLIDPLRRCRRPRRRGIPIS